MEVNILRQEDWEEELISRVLINIYTGPFIFCHRCFIYIYIYIIYIYIYNIYIYIYIYICVCVCFIPICICEYIYIYIYIYTHVCTNESVCVKVGGGIDKVDIDVSVYTEIVKKAKCACVYRLRRMFIERKRGFI